MKRVKKFLVFILILSCAKLPTTRFELKEELARPMNEQLRPFISDGCSKWPDGTLKKPDAWLKCCFKHDQQYWLGGTQSQRYNADQQLKACVKEEFADWMSIVMYLGVRIGGVAEFQTSYRWGYGWNYDRGYLPLTQKEVNYAKTIAPKESDAIEKYLRQN